MDDDRYTTVVWVMLDNCLVRDDGVWTEGWFQSIVVVEEL